MAAEVLTLESLRDRIDNLIKDGYGDNEIRVDRFNFSLVDSVLERMIIREKILRDKAIEESDERLTSMSEKIRKKYGNNRDVSWEYLHPDLDFDFYNSIAAECAEKKSEDAIWFRESIISKGFDWICEDGDFISFD